MTVDLVAPFRLDGKVAIVTGASYGLGVLFAEILATAGADVVITARSADRLADTAAVVEATGRTCLQVAGDVTEYADCERVAAETMARFGRIDVLVNNAGWADDRLVRTEHCEPEMFTKMVGTDLNGLFYMTRAVAPDMLRGGGGSIINLSSIFGNAGSENRTAGYFAAPTSRRTACSTSPATPPSSPGCWLANGATAICGSTRSLPTSSSRR